MGDGPVAFYGKNQGEDDEERTNDDLCVGPPAGGACLDDANLVLQDYLTAESLALDLP